MPWCHGQIWSQSPGRNREGATQDHSRFWCIEFVSTSSIHAKRAAGAQHCSSTSSCSSQLTLSSFLPERRVLGNETAQWCFVHPALPNDKRMPSESKASADSKDEKAGEKNYAGGSSEAKTHGSHEKAGAKDDDGSSFDPENNDLVNKVISFFFDNDEFAHTFETFAENHCHAFDLDSDEMKLEYTDIYNEFLALFEEKLEGRQPEVLALPDCSVLRAVCVCGSVHQIAGRYRARVLRIGAPSVRDRPSVRHRALLRDSGGHCRLRRVRANDASNKRGCVAGEALKLAQ
ncbi:hypothetical protein ON010_g685 [Phytophthora cinnamomi]|nr:hypothetical protein ON010_g685 [Phytophthora cinnamomi]